MRRRSVTLAIFAILAISGGIFSLWLRPSPEMVEYFDGNFTTSLGIATMEQAHLKALPHKGVWIYVLNSRYELLVVRRGSAMKTCPNTLSIIGEHTDPKDTSPMETVARGLREEVINPRNLWQLPPVALGSEELRHTYADGRRDIQLSQRFYVVHPEPLQHVDLHPSEAKHPRGRFYALEVVARMLADRPQDFCDDNLRQRVFVRGLRAVCESLDFLAPAGCGQFANSTPDDSV